MSSASENHIAVLDIGKTHVKLHVLNSLFESVSSKQMKNTVKNSGEYPEIETEAIWLWLLSGMKRASNKYNISAISITTHGATAALVDRNSINEDGLVLPILDYEYNLTGNNIENYSAIRPDFSKTFSPELPAGLNLGRQIYWLKNKYPSQFSNVTDILMYPQYWVWRLTGTLCSEITSLGCHTDLWSINDNDFSSLVNKMAIKDLFPKRVPAWHNTGKIKAELQAELGIKSNCQVFTGIHDSNASYLRYRLTKKEQPFTVISSGTWTILMASQVSLEKIDLNKDMLANIDALGQPTACARFMGGREFEIICEKTGANLTDNFIESDLQAVIEHEVFALPDFSNGSGPFGGREGEITGSITKVSGIAVATLYCALMIDYQLDMLGAKGDIFIEGSFLKNPLLCATLNQLRSEQTVFISNDSTGTVQGAACLTQWDKKEFNLDTSKPNVSKLINLTAYKQKWRTLAHSIN